VQDPIRLGKHSEPEPGISVLNYSSNQYAEEHPKPDDILLLIEVSDSTLKWDRTVKYKLYAAANIPEYCIINLIDYQIEAFQSPKNGKYQTHLIFKKGDLLALPFEKTLEVDAILR
jgi:Uma2 family endonuclease